MAAAVAVAQEEGDEAPGFVEWREQFISQERGSRMVHYYLEDSSGESHLAVVGKERSVRHMLYVVSEEFCRAFGTKCNKFGASSMKWRSRREVVDWLVSFLPRRIYSGDHHSKSPKTNSAHSLDAGATGNRINGSGSFMHEHKDHLRILKASNSDIEWAGLSWTCGKQLRHFQAFHCNGTTITAHSFVLVMSEEENQYLAYLEDMYEDKKGQKKIKVRWFHQNQEVICHIPPPAPHPREVFITSFSQVISAECVDDLATILTPDHYEKCLAALPYASSAGIHLCFRKFSNNKFKPFDLTSLTGYFDQAVLSCLNICTVSGEEGLENTSKHSRTKRIRLAKGRPRSLTESLGIRISGRANDIMACTPSYHTSNYIPARRPLSVKFIGPRNYLVPYKVDENIELLCQDSGIRGCWFKCTVLKLSQKGLKVRYDDVPNDDGCGNLEEWVSAFKLAAPDKLGMRCVGRLTIRPCLERKCLSDAAAALQIGTPVDARWSDGWWEGVVIGIDSCRDNDDLQVYFPGEDVFLTCQRKYVRISKEWVGNRWIDIEAKPDILSAITAVSPGAKLSACSTFPKVMESGSSAMFDQEILASKVDLIEEDSKAVVSLSSETDELLEIMKQIYPMKRSRDSGVVGDSAEGDEDGSDS